MTLLILLTCFLLTYIIIYAVNSNRTYQRFQADREAVFATAARLIKSGHRDELISELEKRENLRKEWSNERDYLTALENIEKGRAE